MTKDKANPVKHPPPPFFFFFFQSGAIIRKYFKISPADFFPRNDIIIPEMVIVQKRK